MKTKLVFSCVVFGLVIGACSGGESKPPEESRALAAEQRKPTEVPAAPARDIESAPPVAPAVPVAQAPGGGDNSGVGLCGDTRAGQPMCPLQKWMEDNLGPAMEQRDTTRIAEALAKIPALAPDASWNSGAQGWSAIAEAGAEKARAGDFDGAKASCKGCHKAFRERYRTEYRTRPVASP